MQNHVAIFIRQTPEDIWSILTANTCHNNLVVSNSSGRFKMMQVNSRKELVEEFENTKRDILNRIDRPVLIYEGQINWG